MIASENPRKLINKLAIAKRQLKNARTREERMAISNYLYLLDDSIANVSPEYTPSDKLAFLPDEENKELDRKFEDHNNKMIRNFIEYKDFHKAFLEKVYKKTGSARKKIIEDEYSGVTELSEEEFYNIFFDFINKIGLAKYFDKFIKTKRIYNTNNNDDKSRLGYTLFNPITLAHEFGHVWDLTRTNWNADEWNTFFYQSFYGEVIPKTFERLFIDHLVENNLYIPEAKDELFDRHNMNYEFVLASYVVSLIPDIYLIDGSYERMPHSKIYKLVERNFHKKNQIRRFINKCDDIEVKDLYQYAYGDIISMILREEVRDSSFSLDVLSEFTQYRSKPFNPEVLEKFKVTPDRYVKLYKKDIELLTK